MSRAEADDDLRAPPRQERQTVAQPPDGTSFDMAALTPRDRYTLLRDTVMPRPIAWVSTVDAAGRANLAPFSFFNVVSAAPPILGFSVGPRDDDFEAERPLPKDTLANVRATGELVVNLVPELLLDRMVRTSDPLPPGEDEFVHAGLAAAPSVRVRPPRVREAFVAFECRVYDIIQLQTHHWVMGEVIQAHIRDAVYLGAGRGAHRVDLLRQAASRPVARLDRARYALTRDVVVRRRQESPATAGRDDALAPAAQPDPG